MRHLRLGLEDRAHELRKVAVDVHDLLELVEHERDLPLALRAELARELEEPLERRVDVLRVPTGVEAEAEPAGRGVDGDDGCDPETREHPQPLARAEERGGNVLVDRLRQLLGELLLRRCRHEVGVRDEHALCDRLLRGAPDE